MKMSRALPFVFALAGISAIGGSAAAQQDKPCIANLPSPTEAQMADGKEWYWMSEPIEVFGAKYVKYGLTRQLQPGDITLAADYRGVAVGVDAMDPDSREVVYVLVTAHCEFQPYQLES